MFSYYFFLFKKKKKGPDFKCMDVKESWVALLLAWMLEAAGKELLRPHFNISWKNSTFSQSRTHLLNSLE